ncbi:uncharacterized protein A4U43_C06F5860 [Asparagus officinalis]|uniref:Nudix hydrolase domain-containing protein n=1 Tax=Asparagus officinalis TaxID=4686 RepID=A0A5P1EN83_ASPOF|nr:uncharacterized protein A4U43_C06F5860 [Asparagus officinalis]
MDASKSSHFVTVIIIRAALSNPEQIPVNVEPDKHSGWAWYERDLLPDPLFKPLEGVLQERQQVQVPSRPQRGQARRRHGLVAVVAVRFSYPLGQLVDVPVVAHEPEVGERVNRGSTGVSLMLFVVM